MIYKYLPILAILNLLVIVPVFAQPLNSLQAEATSFADAFKFMAASLAFGAAAVGAGLAVGRAGSSGLAATAERPEMRTTAIIITALGEAIAIYGIVVAILILGA
jgi:V/A-type H+-transporting ATPase subunit K